MVIGGAQGVDVAPRVDVYLSFGLLRRHIERGPDGGACLRHRHILRKLPRQTQVCQLGDAVLCQQDVVGFDVAMDDAVFPCVVERAGYLENDLGSFLRAESVALGEQLPDARSIDVLHGEVVQAARLAGVQSLDYVYVIELAGRPRFAKKSCDELLVRRESLGKHFDGDDAVHADLSRLVDCAHASLAKLAHQLEPGDTNRFLLATHRVSPGTALFFHKG